MSVRLVFLSLFCHELHKLHEFGIIRAICVIRGKCLVKLLSSGMIAPERREVNRGVSLGFPAFPFSCRMGKLCREGNQRKNEE